MDGWDHAEHPFKSKAKKPSAADKLQAERAGISSDDDVGDAAHYAASWLNETVRRSVASAADAEDGKSGEPLGPGWRHGVGAELTAGLLVEGRPSVDRLHDEAVQATLPVFTLSGQRCGVLGGLSDVKWQLPLPQMRHDLDPTGSSRAAITTNLFTAIALHDIPTVEFILNVEKFPIAGLRSHRGRSPLHAAVLAESPLVTGLLITHGVDPNVKDEDGHTPLTLCLLPDEELAALGDAPPPRLLEKRRRATFALPLVSHRDTHYHKYATCSAAAPAMPACLLADREAPAKRTDCVLFVPCSVGTHPGRARWCQDVGTRLDVSRDALQFSRAAHPPLPRARCGRSEGAQGDDGPEAGRRVEESREEKGKVRATDVARRSQDSWHDALGSRSEHLLWVVWRWRAVWMRCGGRISPPMGRAAVPPVSTVLARTRHGKARQQQLAAARFAWRGRVLLLLCCVCVCAQVCV